MSGSTDYTAADIARIEGVGERTVRRWCEEGRLVYRRTLGGHIRISRGALEEARAKVQADVEAEREARRLRAEKRKTEKRWRRARGDKTDR